MGEGGLRTQVSPRSFCRVFNTACSSTRVYINTMLLSLTALFLFLEKSLKSWWFKHYIISRGKLRWCQKTMLRKRFDWGTNIEEEAKFWQRDLICNIGRCVHQHKSGPSRSSLLVLWPQHHAQGQRLKKGRVTKQVFSLSICRSLVGQTTTFIT